ncbi:hypothetical protein [Melissococcus sp. OM08-11BH]|uniref:hypothetical protein n=1 Tax=Melissococcus sp. OM08-11BH TaxID=2293110 RepID=UPI000E4D176F|nr:hypothetical protein [Melissococcus sp. OM08-11BH]RGI30858.1 hypothetical protein DXC12_04475 [Melissococcus sp. OM08-11BH]
MVEKTEKENWQKDALNSKTSLGWAIMRAVGDLWVIVDTSKAVPYMTKQEIEDFKQMDELTVEGFHRKYKRFIASLYGENIVFVTSNLKQAEDVLYGRLSIDDLNKFHGFATQEDQERVRNLIIESGL